MNIRRQVFEDAWIFEAIMKRAVEVLMDGTILIDGRPAELRCAKRGGHPSVLITHGDKERRVRAERVVALALLPNPGRYGEIRHIDGNLGNLQPDNLVWVQGKEKAVPRVSGPEVAAIRSSKIPVSYLAIQYNLPVAEIERMRSSPARPSFTLGR